MLIRPTVHFQYCQYLYSDKKNAEYAIKNQFPVSVPTMIDELVSGAANTESKINQMIKALD